MDPFVGQLMLVGFNFAPKGYATCSGQLMSIAQNTALFSLLGTYYGGDGKSTFGLPNMQGNVGMGMGQGPGLSQYFIGETGGSQTVTLLQSEVPNHTHNLMVTGSAAKENSPSGNVLADIKGGTSVYSATSTPQTQMSPNAVSIYGSSQPHNNLMPFQCLLWIIALQGVFPARQ